MLGNHNTTAASRVLIDAPKYYSVQVDHRGNYGQVAEVFDPKKHPEKEGSFAGTFIFSQEQRENMETFYRSYVDSLFVSDGNGKQNGRWIAYYSQSYGLWKATGQEMNGTNFIVAKAWTVDLEREEGVAKGALLTTSNDPLTIDKLCIWAKQKI